VPSFRPFAHRIGPHRIEAVRRLVDDSAEHDEVVIVAEKLGKGLEGGREGIQHFHPEISQESHVVPVVLRALAELVEVFRRRVVVRPRERPPRIPVDRAEPGTDRIEPLRSEVPFHRARSRLLEPAFHLGGEPLERLALARLRLATTDEEIADRGDPRTIEQLGESRRELVEGLDHRAGVARRGEAPARVAEEAVLALEDLLSELAANEAQRRADLLEALARFMDPLVEVPALTAHVENRLVDLLDDDASDPLGNRLARTESIGHLSLNPFLRAP